jgi:hypothetical protein
MKNSMFSKRVTRNVLSALLIASSALSVHNLARAADANDQLQNVTPQASTTRNHAADYESRFWARNLRLDGFDGARLVKAQFVPAPYCYTFAGPVCAMGVAVPAGAPCTCPVGWTYLPGSAGF